MKFAVERSVFVKSLAHMQSIVERRPTVTIMGNVKMVALSDDQGDWLAITVTNSEIELTERIPAKVQKAGELTASSVKLYDVVRKIADGVQIEGDFVAARNLLQLKAGRARFNLATLPASDFYTMPAGELPHTFTLPVPTLKSLISKTLFASALDEVKHYLNSIYLHSQKTDKGNMLTAAATDGFRLACTSEPLPEEDIPGVIVPRKTIAELGKLLDDTANDEVQIELSPNQIRFALTNMVMNSRLIDATYPEYERVIPTDNNKVAEVDADALHAVIDRVAVFSEKSSRIKLSFAQGKLTLTATSSDEGSAEEDLEINYDGENLETYFNYRYLLDIISQTRGGKVKCALLDTLSPALFTNPEDENSKYVLMPMPV
jgi:DNA polymerase-3 subunit beta